MRPLSLFLLGVCALFAQTDSASLRVLVQDSSESAVAGAQVVLRNANTATQSEARTSADGYAV
ncbi:MAG: carboxypeptidase-like regulatory domain-containing protein, partial [Bryobacteraceae bacterium]|nr:carboxypeptidase-like regulatory domain-containing protein [Bryobacteraceae bacterium]